MVALICLPTRSINMNPIRLSPVTRRILAGVAMFGLIVPNGLFLWVAFSDPAAITRALADPVARVFIGEAFLLMALLAWLIRLAGARPGWLAFVLYSLVGSLAFSVPAWLWLASRDTRPARPEPGRVNTPAGD
jgi:hypothetical protein